MQTSGVARAAPSTTPEPQLTSGPTAAAADVVRAVQDVTNTQAPASTQVNPTPDAAVVAVDLKSAAVVSIPTNASETVSLGTPGNIVGIGLPAGPDVQRAQVDPLSKTVVYSDAGNDFDLAVQATANAGVQVMSVLNGPEAPRSYAYPLSLPDGARLAPTSAGGADIRNARGEAIASIAPPWAVDAEGTAVPTHYIFQGSVLTQVVEPAANASYPVVADPTVTRNCGIVTCTWYISVAKTREISQMMDRTPSAMAGGLSALAACTILALPSGPGAVIAGMACGVVTAIGGPLLQMKFDNARLSGECITLAAGVRSVLGQVSPKSNGYCVLS